jgi:hypothetical protein
VHSAGPGPAQDYGPWGQRPATTVPGQPPELRLVGSAQWPKRPGRPARRGARARCSHRAHERSGVARWRGRCDLAGGLGVAQVAALAPIEQGSVSGKAVGGGAQPSGGAAWRRWRMLRAVAFNGGEAAPVTDDIDGVALQCQGRREKVRGE